MWKFCELLGAVRVAEIEALPRILVLHVHVHPALADFDAGELRLAGFEVALESACFPIVASAGSDSVKQDVDVSSKLSAWVAEDCVDVVDEACAKDKHLEESRGLHDVEGEVGSILEKLIGDGKERIVLMLCPEKHRPILFLYAVSVISGNHPIPSHSR